MLAGGTLYYAHDPTNNSYCRAPVESCVCIIYILLYTWENCGPLYRRVKEYEILNT